METDDARKISVSEVEEKYPINDYEEYYEDDIHLPPSTELIPDEYEHKDNKKGLLLIFYSKSDKGNKDVVVKEFSDQGYDVSNVFQLTTYDFVLEKLNSVATQNNSDKSCLIIFFLGNAEKEDKFLLDEDQNNYIVLKDVWLNFTAHKCPSFRNKPKIFIFQASKKPPVRSFDTIRFADAPKGAYNVPSEADILLIYKRVESTANRETFIKELCNKIDQMGKKDDIIGLVTRTNIKEKRPLVISTLTRKFYVTSSAQRGHYYEFDQNHQSTLNELKILRLSVSNKSLNESSRKNITIQADSSKSGPVKPSQKNKAKDKLQDRPRWK